MQKLKETHIAPSAELNGNDNYMEEVCKHDYKAFLETHPEYKGEIGAREDSFRTIAEAGLGLLADNHYASDDVKEKVKII